MRCLAVLVLALVCASEATAHPWFWVGYIKEQNLECGAQPKGPLGSHKAPKADPSITLTVTDAKGAKATAACPGATYDVLIKFPESREAFVTTTVGTLAKGLGDAKPGTCKNTLVMPKGSDDKASKSDAYETTWEVPCDATGSAKVMVTSATGKSSALLTSSASVPIKASCPDVKCSGGFTSANSTADALALPAESPTSTSTAESAPAPESPAPAEAPAAPSPEPAKSSAGAAVVATLTALAGGLAVVMV